MIADDEDADAALIELFGGDAPVHEAGRRKKFEGKMSIRPDDGRRKRATGRTAQFNVMMKPALKAAIGKAAHKAGKTVTAWIEEAALAHIKAGAKS